MAGSETNGADGEALRAVCRRMRRHIVEMTHAAQSGHPGGSLSSVELVAALYFGGVMRHDPSRPDWAERDRFVLSKGHATPVIYAALAEAGYFDASELSSFRSVRVAAAGSRDAGGGRRGLR